MSEAEGGGGEDVVEGGVDGGVVLVRSACGTGCRIPVTAIAVGCRGPCHRLYCCRYR